MTDANEALRALDEARHKFDLCGASFEYEIIRAHLTDPCYVRVPVEPTDEMLSAGWEALRNDKADPMLYTRKAAIAYRAMLAAAQEASHD